MTLVTPWEHLDVCDSCLSRSLKWWRQAHQAWREGNMTGETTSFPSHPK